MMMCWAPQKCTDLTEFAWSLQGHCVSAMNSLAPGKFEWNFRDVIFKQILVIEGWGISSEIALI